MLLPVEVIADSPAVDTVDPGDQPAPASGKSTRRVTSGPELLQAVGLLLGLLVVFLWTPLTTNGYYSPSDLIQSSPLSRTAPDDYQFGNVLLTDPVQQMQPWLEWNRQHIRSGDLPVWNPFNAGGTPHMASMVSAVFSPFSAPFYPLGFRAALVAAAASKLLILGLFTYLFLRRVRVSHLGGLVGAVAFMFSAFNVVWLSWPHAAATICLPIGLYLAEVALAAGQGAPLRARLAWAGYGLSVTASLFGGHPETMFFAWGMVLAYVPLRLLCSADQRSRTRRERIGELGRFGFASVLGVGLAGIQLLPFWEYLQRSTSYIEGAERGSAHFDIHYSPLHAFPNLFGSPSERYYDPAQLASALRFGDTPVQSNYNEASSFYIGLLVLLLAGIAIVALIRRRTFVPVFLAAAAAIWFVYVHDIGGISRVVGSLPLVELSPRNRSHAVWLFSVACLAGFGLDAVRAAAARQRVTVAMGVVAGALFLTGAGIAAKRDLLDRTVRFVGSLGDTPLAESSVRDHVAFVVVTLAIGTVAVVALVLFGRDDRVRIGAGVVIVGAVFAHSGWMLRDYNPTIPPAYFFPTSPGMSALKQAVGPDTVSLGVLLSADSNLWYDVRIPDSYDGLGVYRSDVLRRRLAKLAMSGSPEALALANSRTVEVLGIRYVASQTYPFAVPATTIPTGPSFVAERSGMHAMSVFAVPASPEPGAPCHVTLDLVDQFSSTVVAQGSAPCRLPFTTVDFPAQADSFGRRYLARFGGTAVVGGLVPWADGEHGMRQVDGPERVALFRMPDTPARFFSPAQARPAGTDGAALDSMMRADFRMDGTALVHADIAATTGMPGVVQLVSESATRVHLRVTRTDPGWVVAMQTHYPGWEATVDGKPAGVERADYAYSAVAVDAGTRDVVLRYRPDSVRYGLMLTVASAAVFGGWLLVPYVLRPAYGRRPSGISARRGLALSRADRTGSVRPQSAAMAGSSHATPNSSSAL